MTAAGRPPHIGVKRGYDPDMIHGPVSSNAQLKAATMQRRCQETNDAQNSYGAGYDASQHAQKHSRTQHRVEHADASPGQEQTADCKAPRQTVKVKAIAVELCAGSAKLSFQLHARVFCQFKLIGSATSIHHECQSSRLI